MAATFSRTVRAMQPCGRSGLLFDLSLFVLFVAWLGWFLLGDVAVFEVSANARLETQSAPHSVAVSLPGRVVETRLTIGQRVAEGDVLMRLDAEADRLAVEEHVTHVQSCCARCVAIRHEIEAEQTALAAQSKARSSAAEEAHAQEEEAEARYRFAAINLERAKQLKAKRAASDQEVDLANADVEAARAKVAAVRMGGLRSGRDRAALESERQARLAKLEREVQELEGTILVEEATIRTLKRKVAERDIHAPVTGRMGDVNVQYQVGSYVSGGARVGVVIPDGDPQIVAHFPMATLGRLCLGQPARLRLDGFPWVQYGSLPAKVRRVGGEPNAGLIQVELELLADVPSAIPLEHGLPGIVEVEVDRVAPVILVLRAAGKLLTAKQGTMDPAPSAPTRPVSAMSSPRSAPGD